MKHNKESKNDKAVVKVITVHLNIDRPRLDNKRNYSFRKECEYYKPWLSKNDVSQKKKKKLRGKEKEKEKGCSCANNCMFSSIENWYYIKPKHVLQSNT